LQDTKFPPPFQIEHLCQLPTNLARTELGVRPCVAYLSATPGNDWPRGKNVPSAEEVLIPRLDAKEVAAVFSAPFHNFLKATDEYVSEPAGNYGSEASGFPAKWYQGSWTD